jgi:hypothetical protein
MEDMKKVQEFIDKIDNLKKDNKLDLSSDQDLSIAVMNLVSLEEHFFFSGAKTGETKYYDLIKDIREMRKDLLGRLVKNPEGEEWCISKHLLAASMRLTEVGTKELGRDHKEAAYDLFNKAYNLYSLFWGLNLKLIDTGAVKAIDDQALNKHDKKPQGFMGKMGELVKKAVNCCLE